MDDIFLKIANIINDSNTVGMVNVKISDYDADEIEYNYLNCILKSIKGGDITEVFKFVIDYEFEKIVKNNNLDDSKLKKLLVVKHLAPMIRDRDYDTMLSFSRGFTTGCTYDAMNVVLGLIPMNNVPKNLLELVEKSKRI